MCSVTGKIASIVQRKSSCRHQQFNVTHEFKGHKSQTWKNFSFSSASFNSSSTWSTKFDSGNSTSAKHGWNTNMHRCKKWKFDGKHDHTADLQITFKKELTCAAQVDTRALMRSRCISMVSVSAICSARHNSRTTCNKWFHLRVNTTDRAAPGNVICLQQTHKIQGWEMKIFNNSFQMRHTVPHRWKKY